MLAACDRLFPRKPENRKRWRLVLIAAYILGCRLDELFHIMGAHIRYLDEVKQVGLIELNMPENRTKIHTKKMPITTWLFDEMEAGGIFNKAARSVISSPYAHQAYPNTSAATSVYFGKTVSMS